MSHPARALEAMDGVLEVACEHAKATRVEYRIVVRARILCAAFSGVANEENARHNGVHTDTVRKARLRAPIMNVGIDHDTSEFAVESLRRWWRRMGSRAYPDATRLLITADGGGSNGHRTRLWKLELQHFADESGLDLTVAHYPPGTSKWNKIEHRMFCHITENWRGRPLESVETIVSLIGSTTTKTGLRINAALDKNSYAKGITVSDAELASVNVQPARFHGDWNYTIRPAPT